VCKNLHILGYIYIVYSGSGFLEERLDSLKDNEKNACNAFIEILKKIKGVTYEIIELPEEKNRNTQDVEAILAPTDDEGQSPKIAVEHTIVEAHDKQLTYVNQLYDIVENINRMCQQKLPIDRYFSLCIPPPLVRGTKEEINQLIKEMSHWVINIAETSTISQFNQFEKWISRLYNGYKVSLTCGDSFSEVNGSVGMMPTRPENAEKERRDRFRRAMEDKLPKLIKYKEKGFATAFLLEDISFSHINSGDNLKDLIPNQYNSEFQSKIDYVVIFVSNEKKMIVGNVWKEESQLYSEIPDHRRFSFQQ